MESQLRVGVDVGCHSHRVGIADPEGSLVEEFDISHSEAGFQEFFRRVEERRAELGVPVAVAMEGYNGYARPLDRLVQEKGYRLFNVNNLKLARFKEVFPDAAKTDPIDALGGLDPIQVQSGTSVHAKSRISRRGHREVRKCLFEATLSAARFNPGIRAIYRRLKDEGKPDKVARIAAARKLLLLAHAACESVEPFRAPAENGQGVLQELPSCSARAEQPLTRRYSMPVARAAQSEHL